MIPQEEDLSFSVKGFCQLGKVDWVVALGVDKIVQENDGRAPGRDRVVVPLDKAGVHLRKVTERPPVVGNDAFMSEVVVGG